MAYRGFYQEILVSVKCKVTVVVLQRQLFWQQFLSCHERLYRNYLRRVALVSTHPPPTRSRDSRHTGSPRASWSTSLARSSRSPPCKCINISTCQHINMSTYHVNTPPGSHLAGAPDGSANLGPQRPRTRGKAGWDFFSLACTVWPWLVTLQT